MVGITEANAVLGSIKAAFDIAKGVQALKTSTEIRQATSDMLDALLNAKIAAVEAHEAEMALVQRVRELETEIVNREAWDGEKQRYELKRFYPGSLAYALKPGMEGGEPPHYLCQHCYQRGHKSRLQATSELKMRWRVHRCHSCKDEVTIGNEMGLSESEPPPTPTPTRQVIMKRPRGV